MKHKDLKIDFRYLSGNIACLSVDSISGESVHNDINNEEAIIIFNSLVGEKEDCQTVKTLLKENQELKKQLEDKEDFITKLQATKDKLDKWDRENYYQQKEFIEYMNKIIEELECDDVDDEEMKGYLIQRIDTFKEILSKYKEIMNGTERN